MRNLAALLVVLGGAIAANAQVIDSFTFNQATVTRNTAGTSTDTVSDASILGGERELAVTYVSGTNNFAVGVAGGTLDSNADAGVIGNFTLTYNGAGSAGLNLNLSPLTAADLFFTFDRNFLDLNSFVDVTLTDGGGDSATISNFLVNGGGAPAQTVNIGFSTFSNIGALDLTDIDSIVFSFEGLQQATNFTLGELRITSIPEPTTYALIGLVAVGGLVARRRRNAKAN